MDKKEGLRRRYERREKMDKKERSRRRNERGGKMNDGRKFYWEISNNNNFFQF